MLIAALLAVIAQVSDEAPPPTLAPYVAPTQPSATVDDPRLARMAALYAEICLRAFPDDDAVVRLMAAKRATPLSAEDVRITMRDDPARGWTLPDGDGTISIFIEFPPFHACSVRWDAPAGATDWSPYRAAIAPWLAANPGFATLPPQRLDHGPIHSVMTLDGRVTPNDVEMLMAINQQPLDAQSNPRPERGVDRRLVRSIRAR